MAGSGAHFYEPRDGHGLRHDPFNALVAPRPIGWISTCNPAGIANLAPYSFFNALNYQPPLIGFSSIGWKDSIENIKQTSEFCWNLASVELADAVNLSCAPAPADVDEFGFSGVAAAPSRLIRAPRVIESPANFECKLCDIIQLKDGGHNLVESWFVIGEVVAVHIDPAIIDDNAVVTTLAANPLLRGGGPIEYFGVTAQGRYALRRPAWPLDHDL
jgi:flavin reductase (DIM6/NTAB) family NADH-FMN oxidoreductase RutF